ncbi:MAG: TolB family protein, partial [Arenimonas sp.]
MNSRFAFVALMLPMLFSSQVFATRGMDVRDMVNFDRVSEPTLSPDGKTVVYGLRQVDFAANKAKTGFWKQSLNSKQAPIRITAEGFNVNSPVFSADGQSIYFLSAKSGSMQLWKQALSGGDALQVSDYPLDIGSYKISPDGKSVAFSLEVFNDCKDLACTKKRLDDVGASKVTGVLYDQLFIRHWDTWADGRRNQLFV